MDLSAIAKLAKTRQNLKFYRVHPRDNYSASPSGHILDSLGKVYTPTLDDIAADYALDCKHPIENVVAKGLTLSEGGHCRYCDQDVKLKAEDQPPSLPLSPFVLKETEPPIQTPNQMLYPSPKPAEKDRPLKMSQIEAQANESVRRVLSGFSYKRDILNER